MNDRTPFAERTKYRAAHSTLEIATHIADHIADHVFPPEYGLGKGLVCIAKDLGYDTKQPRTQAAIDLVLTARSDSRCWETNKEDAQ